MSPFRTSNRPRLKTHFTQTSCAVTRELLVVRNVRKCLRVSLDDAAGPDELLKEGLEARMRDDLDPYSTTTWRLSEVAEFIEKAAASSK